MARTEAHAAPVRQPGRPLNLPREAAVTVARSLQEMRAAFATAYRLPLDRRVVRAFDEVRRLLTGRPPAPATAVFTDGRWRLEGIGTLSAMPDFPEILALLEQSARQVGKGLSPAAEAPEPSFLLDGEALAVIKDADARWVKGERSGAVVAAADRALSALAFEMADQMELADVIPARALATLAVHRALAGAPAAREETLVAEAMGYHRRAREVARTLPAVDPVRLYVGAEDEPLRQAAERGDASPGVRYLWLRRLEQQDDEAAERAFREAWFQQPDLLLAGVSARLHGDFFPESDLLPEAQAALVLMNAARVTGGGIRGLADPAFWTSRSPAHVKLVMAVRAVMDDLGAAREALGARFESEMSRLGHGSDGFLGADGLQHFYSALFYSSLMKTGLFYLDKLNSTEAAAQFAATLGAPRTAAQRDFGRWYRTLVASKGGQAVDAALFYGLRGMESFGGRPLLRVFQELRDQADWGDPAMVGAVKRIVPNLDTRPHAVGAMATLAFDGLSHLGMAEQLARSAVQLGDDLSLAAWLAERDQDLPAMRRLLGRPDLAADRRCDLVVKLLELKALTVAEARRSFRQLLAPAGDDWSQRSCFSDWLRERKEVDEQRAVLREYLDRRLDVFSRLAAHTALARSYREQGRIKEGLAAIAPVATSQQLGASAEVARLRLADGDKIDAIEMAEQMTRRYPGPRSLALLAEIHWRAGDPEGAADALAEGTSGVRMVDWRWKIGEVFGEVFARRPVIEGLAAFSALAELIKDPFALGNLAHAAHAAGNNELSFAIDSQLRTPGLGQLEITMDAYSSLRRWKGKSAALDWIRTEVPRPALQPLSMFAFASEEDDLLWDLIPDPQGAGSKQDFTWLMRAASYRRGRGKDTLHGAILRAHYQGPGASYYHEVGRYLLGLTDEKSILELARDGRRQCEIAFYVGLRAQSEGRYQEASDWYQAAFETGSTRDGEFRWANDLLQQWKSSGLSLARLQQRGQ